MLKRFGSGTFKCGVGAVVPTPFSLRGGWGFVFW